MSRWLLAAGALVIATAVAGLLWQLRAGDAGHGGETEPGERRARPTGSATPEAPTPSAPGERPELATDVGAPIPTAPSRPRGDTSAEQAAAADRSAQTEQAMVEAERLFQEGDHEAARVAAHLVLDARPDDPRMLRVVVMSACALGVAKEARQYYPRLAEGERGAVVARCRGHGIHLDR